MSNLAQTKQTMTNEPEPTTTAIAQRSGSDDGSIIRSPKDYQAKLKTWQTERCHILSPVANFSGMPAIYGLVAARVDINPDPAGGEVYADPLFCRDGEVAIAKPGLSKIAQAAGMTIKTERTDPRTIPNYWEVRATIRFIGLDGTPQEMDATSEYDLRDGAPRIRSFQPKQVQAARTHGLRGCEARAINAAIRQYGIRQKYTKAELGKPFVVVRVVHNPDMSDPVQRQIITQNASGGSARLGFGAPRPAPDANVIDVVGETPDPPAPPSTTTPEEPKGRIVEAVRNDFEAGTFEVILDGGEILVTHDKAVADRAFEAKKSGGRVLPVLDQAGLLVQFKPSVSAEKY